MPIPPPTPEGSTPNLPSGVGGGMGKTAHDIKHLKTNTIKYYQSMKIGLLFICLLAFCTPSVLMAQKCYDYACNINKAKAALKSENYDEALAYAKAAKAYPNANIAEADALVDAVFKGIKAQKQKAIDEKRKAELARVEAEEATKRAEKTARAAENSAVFMQVLGRDSNLAVQMMRYNFRRHPQNNVSLDMYQKVLSTQSAFLVKILRGHSEDIKEAVFSPDGKKVLACDDKSARLWDIVTGKSVHFLVGHLKAVNTVAFSPDGKKALTGSADNTAKLWDVETGKVIKTFVGHTEAVNHIAFSSDGKYIATASADNTAKLWDIETGKAIKTFVSENGIGEITFLTSGKKLLTIHNGKSVKRWDIETEKEEKTLLFSEGLSAISPDGTKVLREVYDSSSIQVLDIETGNIEQTFVSFGTYNIQVKFSPDSKKVIMGNENKRAKLWDIKTGKLEQTFLGHTSYVTSVAVSPDGKQVLTGAWDGEIRVWNMGRDRAEKKIIGHTEWVKDMAFSPDRKKILTGSNDSTARIWDIETGLEEKRFVESIGIIAVAYSPDGKKILTSSRGTPKLWDIETGTWEKTFRGHGNTVFSLGFSPDSKKVFTGSFDRIVRIWDRASGSLERTFDGHNETILNFSFSADGKKLLASDYDHQSILWNIETGKEENKLAGTAQAVALVLFGDMNKKSRNDYLNNVGKIWQNETAKLQNTGVAIALPKTAFSSDKKKMIMGSSGTVSQLWHIESLGETQFFIEPDEVYAVAISPDGKKIATGGKDKIVRLWDVQTDEIEATTYRFSLYEMHKAGLIIEPEDTPQYIKDSTAFADNIRKDTVEHNKLMAEWKSTPQYKQALEAYEEDLKIKQALEIEKERKRFLDYVAKITEEATTENQDFVSYLKDEISNVKDGRKGYQLYGVLIDTLESRWADNMSNRDLVNQLVSAYYERAWSGFFRNQFYQSEEDIKAALTLDSTKEYLNLLLPPALLLQGKFQEAKAEYEKWKDKPLNLGGFPTFREAFLQDFITFEDAAVHGIVIHNKRKEDVAAIRKLLEKKE